MKFSGDTRRDFEKAAAENAQLKDRILGYKDQIRDLRRSLKAMQKAKEIQKAVYEEQLAEKEAVIKELKNRLEHELALKCHDGTNTGTPTSQTPIGKKKVIPNFRGSTGKKKGGQPGHERHMMGIPSMSTTTITFCGSMTFKLFFRLC